MRNKVLLSIALLLILVSASLFTYPEVSKQVAQGQNDVVISRFDKTAENVQGDDGGKDGESDNGNDSGYSTYEAAVADGAVNDEGYLINDDGEVISDYPVVFQMDLDRLYRDSAAYNAALNERQDMETDFSNAALNLTDYGIFALRSNFRNTSLSSLQGDSLAASSASSCENYPRKSFCTFI